MCWHICKICVYTYTHVRCRWEVSGWKKIFLQTSKGCYNSVQYNSKLSSKIRPSEGELGIFHWQLLTLMRISWSPGLGRVIAKKECSEILLGIVIPVLCCALEYTMYAKTWIFEMSVCRFWSFELKLFQTHRSKQHTTPQTKWGTRLVWTIGRERHWSDFCEYYIFVL